MLRDGFNPVSTAMYDQYFKEKLSNFVHYID